MYCNAFILSSKISIALGNDETWIRRMIAFLL